MLPDLISKLMANLCCLTTNKANTKKAYWPFDSAPFISGKVVTEHVRKCMLLHIQASVSPYYTWRFISSPLGWAETNFFIAAAKYLRPIYTQWQNCSLVHFSFPTLHPLISHTGKGLWSALRCSAWQMQFLSPPVQTRPWGCLLGCTCACHWTVPSRKQWNADF